MNATTPISYCFFPSIYLKFNLSNPKGNKSSRVFNIGYNKSLMLNCGCEYTPSMFNDFELINRRYSGGNVIKLKPSSCCWSTEIQESWVR